MADTTTTAPVSADPIHQEGIDHIKGNVGDTTVVATSAGGSDPVAPAAETTTVPATTSTAEPTPSAAAHTETAATDSTVLPLTDTKEPVASNPGAENPSAGIAEGAGGVSTTAATETPAAAAETTTPSTSAATATTPTNQKRKSIIGSFKGMLGLAEDKEGKNASSERKRSVAGRSKSTTSTTKAAETTTTTAAGGAPGEVPKDSTAAEAEAKDEVADPKTDASVPGTETAAATTEGEEAKEEGEEAKEGDAKPKPVDPKKLEHPDAIPEAGGEKLGEKHWGESKVIPDNPKPQKDAGVASADGQPTDEVKDNTAKNTGSASAPGEKKKEKFTDRIKEKLKFGKK